MPGKIGDMHCATTLARIEHSVLYSMSTFDEPRRLSVDAVCINQDDPVEVASQVQRLSLICKPAYRVVVWLGPESDDSAHALSILDYVGAQIEIDGDDDGLCAAPFAEEPT